MKKLTAFLGLILVLVLLSHQAAGALDVETMDNYRITTSISGKDIHVKQEFDITSHSPEPLVPGRCKLLFFEGIEPKNVKVKIGNTALRVDETVEDGKKAISYFVWQPLLTGESTHLTIDFDTENVIRSGLLFSEISFTASDPSVPINDLELIVEAPESNSITYAEPRPSSVNGNRAVFRFDELNPSDSRKVTVEYTPLAILPFLPFHGYWLWLGIVILTLVVSIFIVRRRNLKRYSTLSHT